MNKIIFATGNKDKMKEIRMILSDLDVEILSMKEAGISVDIEENGTTFEENALIKAKAVAAYTDAIVLADDSGLTVDVLDGAPGVYSARYAGHHGDDQANNEKLIRELQGKSDRTGHYVCALALVYPDGREVTAEGYCDGLVQDEPKGDNGFGYDPYFYVPEFEKTMAELSIEEKETISHRGRALRKLINKL